MAISQVKIIVDTLLGIYSARDNYMMGSMLETNFVIDFAYVNSS